MEREMAKKKLIGLIQNALSDLLDSSSSEEEENFVLFPERQLFTPVKDFVDVINLYTESEFKINFRMKRESAEYLIDRYSKSSWYRKRTYKGGRPQLPPNTQILMFLWFCSNKTTIREVSNLFHMSFSRVHTLLNKVLSFMVEEIAPEVINFPQDAAAKEEVAKEFENICGFPNVLGCIDGSYISVRTPKHKIRSRYVNRHDSISVTMQGICDAKLKFLDVFTGVPSKMHNSRVLKLSNNGKQLSRLCWPEYHLLGGSAYPTRTYLLTPYPDNGNLTECERMYNLKFCQTRVKIENAFGMLKCRFRQLTRLHFHDVEIMAKFIIACCALHNICIDKNDLFEEVEYINIEPDSLQSQYIGDDVNETMLTEVGEIKRNQVKELLYNISIDS